MCYACRHCERSPFVDTPPALFWHIIELSSGVVKNPWNGERAGVEVLGRGANWQDITLATLAPKGYFGEVALHDVPRTATVGARGPAELHSLTRADFRELLQRSDRVQEEMRSTSQARVLDTQKRLLRTW